MGRFAHLCLRKDVKGGFMSAKIQPLADYVVAQAEEAASKTASGLYLPDNAQEKPKTAKVIAVGKDVKNVKVGDRIIYGGYSNTDVKIGSEEYMLVKEENIYATVK
jgi:chaperonin GroES